MLPKTKIFCVIGTRPETVKMAPVIWALRKTAWADVRVLVTAQHRQLLDQELTMFGIVPDIDLDIMRPNQGLGALTSRLLAAIDKTLAQEKPDIVLAQGDTTTVMTVALACFYRHINFGHIEAGLRTGNDLNPFPEEINRVIADRLARWHFAPTEGARQNLLREKIADDSIFVTGNTVIDALLQSAARCSDTGIELDDSKRLILVTAHRRENFGAPFRAICHAFMAIANQNEDVQILYPVHPNPNINVVAHSLLGSHPRILLCQPLDYNQFVAAMKRSYIILSDSGGIQEEAPALGKPVLVLRHETERPEAILCEGVKLVGTNIFTIVKETQTLLDDSVAYARMSRCVSPYGDGQAAERIVHILQETLCEIDDISTQAIAAQM